MTSLENVRTAVWSFPGGEQLLAAIVATQIIVTNDEKTGSNNEESKTEIEGSELYVGLSDKNFL